MKRLSIILMLAIFGTAANAVELGSQVAWDEATLELLGKGNAEHGGNLAQTCKACHGERGEGSPVVEQDGEITPAVPGIAGQLATFLYKQLRDYANGERTDSSMTGIAKSLSEQDAADLAAWFASLSLPMNDQDSDDSKLAAAKKIVREGDGKRILPPCFVCHGQKGQGEKIDIPSLAGQQAEYLARSLLAYKSGERHNDIYGRMRLIAKQLSDEEIKQVAEYYQNLK
jgi:cytochrome c553